MSLIKLEENTIISVVSRIIFINKKITAYYEKSHTIEKKSQMSQNEPKMPISALNCIQNSFIQSVRHKLV
jgi:hypothetical protein